MVKYTVVSICYMERMLMAHMVSKGMVLYMGNQGICTYRLGSPGHKVLLSKHMETRWTPVGFFSQR